MSDTLEIKGTIKLIEATQEFSSGFRKREFVVTTEGDYPQDIKFEVVKDKCDSMDRLSAGDSVDVSFNVRGNEYNGKYYVNLQCWKLASNGPQRPQQPPQQQPVPASMDDDDCIPF